MIVLGVILVLVGLLLMVTIIGFIPGVILFLVGCASMITGAILRISRRPKTAR